MSQYRDLLIQEDFDREAAASLRQYPSLNLVCKEISVFYKVTASRVLAWHTRGMAMSGDHRGLIDKAWESATAGETKEAKTRWF